MRVLGINDGHDSGVCLVDDGKIIYASNEERFARKKFFWGFPHGALENLLEYTKIDPRSIEHVAIAGLGKFESENTYTFDESSMTGLRRHGEKIARAMGSVTETKLFAHAVRMYGQLSRESLSHFRNVFYSHGIEAPISFHDHHMCHAASAYFTCGHDPALIVTADGSGDGLSGSVYVGQKGRLDQVAFSPVIHSSGRFWDVITYLCGFKPVRHAGKITGLAAYKPTPDAYKKLRTLYGGDERNLHFLNRERRVWLGELARIKEVMQGYSREEIAYAAQKVLEEAFVKVIRTAIKRTGIGDLALAGGTFANVRLNQILAELPEVKSIWVFPHMGDGGLNAGAAWLAESASRPLMPTYLEHAYLGPEYTTHEIDMALKNHNLPIVPTPNPARFIAEQLSKKRIIGVYQKRMEYGPRALGHRSILAEPTDPTMQDWLNARLARTEFMPFAPMVLAHRAADYFQNYEKGSYAAQYMTMCFTVTDLARQKAPGIVHKDGTARPQIVSSSTNPLIFQALTEYERLSDLPICVNTSFNKHEEPIVCTPEDAIKEFLRGGVDALILENRIIETTRAT